MVAKVIGVSPVIGQHRSDGADANEKGLQG
jgi:hypothetical protein